MHDHMALFIYQPTVSVSIGDASPCLNRTKKTQVNTKQLG